MTRLRQIAGMARHISWRRVKTAARLVARADLRMFWQRARIALSIPDREVEIAAVRPVTANYRQEAWPSDRPLVSVVIPCFNYGQFVAEAVRSVLDQTFGDIEIIVVDGGSTSAESVAALRALSAPKTRVYFRENGRHLVGDNRNFGIARAAGRYICCLDADDRLRPTYLEKAVFLLENYGYDLVSTSMELFGAGTGIVRVLGEPTLADMMEGNEVATCAVFRRELWERAGGFTDFGVGGQHAAEDWCLWMRMAALGARIHNIVEEPLFLYRQHEQGSLSTGADVPSRAAQGGAIRDFNRDFLTKAAIARSRERASLKLKAEDGLINLRLASDPRRTILIAMPFLITGGAERLISEIAAYLASRDYRVIIATTLYTDPEFGDASDWFAPATAEIYHLPRFLEPERWRDFIFYLLETKNVALLWVIGSAVFYDLLPEIKTRVPGLKVVDLLFNTIGHTENNAKYARHIDLNLVENEEVGRFLAARGEPPERVIAIPSGVDLAKHRPAAKPGEALARLGLDRDTFVVGFSSRLAEEKDPEAFVDLAEACRDVPGLAFLMTGAGPFARRIERRVAAAEPGLRFQFLGRVGDVAAVMACYDVLVVPSRLDGRPVVVLEALARGIPVVASRVGALPELVEDGVTGFLCAPGDVAAFAERVRRLAADRELHGRMSQAARRFAEQKLDAREMLKRYEEALSNVLCATGVHAAAE